ncbi:MAG: phage portal protein [Dehalococcoidia bacterium]
MTDFTPASLNRMDTTRLATYRSNLDFYQGTQWQQTSRHRQLVFNYAKVSIDKCTSFLMQGLGFACYPGEETDELKARVRKAEQLLRQFYDQNNLQQLDYETEIDTAILGDGCYKVIWDTDEKRIRITAPDVSGIFVWWLGDDTSRVWRVASRYTLTQDEIAILYGRSIEKKTATITELWTAKDFSLYLDNAIIESKPNPYGFIPVVIFPNVKQPKKFWGESDIPILMQPQRELNRALSQLSRILELSGNPIAVLENIASAEDIKVQPGALWTIPEDAKAYLLDLLQGGGVRLHVDYIDLLYRALHDVSEMPSAAWGGIETDLSGSALNIELGSLIQKVIRKRTIRTNIYHQRNALILKLAEMYMHENFEGINHRVVWGQILPQDVARQAQNEQLLVQAGVHSRRTAMDEMGIQDPDEEFNHWLEERRKILEMNREFRAASTRGGARERAVAAEMEVPE